MADDAGFVLTAWLKAGGDKDFVQRQVAEWLEAHDTRSEASFVLTAWLDTGVKKKKLIQPHVLRWLARHDREEEASFVLSSWLRGEGEPALVRSHVRSWLEENADGPEAGLLIRRWLQARMEPRRNRPSFDREKKVRILESLHYAELFERFLHTRYSGQKRFSLEGSETLIPILEAIVEKAPDMGVR